MWDCESSHSLPLCRWSTCPRWTMKIPDQLLHAKEDSWQFLMVTAELQLQPMLIVIRMGVVHSEVYWLHQMDLKVCSISIKRTKRKLSHFIINDKLTTTDYFCDSAYRTLSTIWLRWAKMLVMSWRQRLGLGSMVACNGKNEWRCAISVATLLVRNRGSIVECWEVCFCFFFLLVLLEPCTHTEQPHSNMYLLLFKHSG
jgi:hypothetical protein